MNTSATSDQPNTQPNDTQHNDTRPAGTGLTTGAGIAIAGIWIAGAALTGLLSWLAFHGPPTDADPTMEGWGAILFLLLLAAPMIAAYNATRMLLAATLGTPTDSL